MKRGLITLVIFIILVGGLFFWWQQGIEAISNNNQITQIFVVQKGEGLRSIARHLKEEKLIRDPIVFFLLVKKLGIDNNIQAGDFRLSPSMTAQQIATELTHGTLDVWVTIPEGLRSEEIAEILKNKLSTYQSAWILELKKHEGYLFPDTYLIPKDADISLIIQIMRNNFDQKWQTLGLQEKQTALTASEIVILASLVEREAKFTEDRPLVASVLSNRLKIDMPLQADATVQYAIGKINGSWWKHPTPEDLKINSPFNTYKNYGLPPAPIANPGLDTLKAAVSPAKTRYFYYLSDKEGRMHYAETLEEHNTNIEKYL
ncbi:endolytic transglycosylase MltG [Candidatus Microgenomates bacterium]|nr:endolytic transglycosylase MltG [Candidatus Microgenomates bacterium]